MRQRFFLNGSRKNAFCRHRLDARVEGREPQFLQRLAPPVGHQAPAHWDQIAPALIRNDDISRVGRTDVVDRLEIRNGRWHRQPVKRVDFLPRVFSGETAAHRVNIATQRPLLYRRRPRARDDILCANPEPRSTARPIDFVLVLFFWLIDTARDVPAPTGQEMTCKKCGGDMRLWLERSAFKSFACATCEFVAIARQDSPKPKDQPPRDDAASLNS